jgi:hypothetical protein
MIFLIALQTKVVIGTDIQPPGNAIFTVYDSIQINVARVSIISYKKDKRIWASVKNI